MTKRWWLLFLLVLSVSGIQAADYLDANTFRVKAEVGKAFAQDLTSHTKITGNYEILYSPDWISITPAGIIFGTPQDSYLGDNELFISATNNSLSKKFHVIVEVVEPTTPILSDYGLTAEVDEIFSAEMKTITGVEGTYSYSQLPSWLKGTDKGVLVGIPKKKHLGTHMIQVKVNALYGVTIFNVNIEVKENNPSINSIKAKVGSYFAINLYQTIGLNGHYYVNAPSWLQLTANTDLIGTPSASDIGLHEVRVEVRRPLKSYHYILYVEVQS